MTDFRALKKQLRLEALARRDGLASDDRIEAAMVLAERAGDLGIAPGSVVSGYWPMRSEMDVRPLMFALMERGCRLCLPAILDKQTIVFRELSRGAALIDMGFGTFGPGPEAEELAPTVMLMPLAAFDRRGHRIGYGAGYYDRAIARLAEARPRLLGVAFDCQEVDAVPDEPHDQKLDALLSESGLREFAPV